MNHNLNWLKLRCQKSLLFFFSLGENDQQRNVSFHLYYEWLVWLVVSILNRIQIIDWILKFSMNSVWFVLMEIENILHQLANFMYTHLRIMKRFKRSSIKNCNMNVLQKYCGMTSITYFRINLKKIKIKFDKTIFHA